MSRTCNRYCKKDPKVIGSLHNPHLTYNDGRGCRTCSVFWPKNLLICPCCGNKLSWRPAAGIRNKQYQNQKKYIE